MKAKRGVLIWLITFVISNVLTTIWYMATDEANMVPYRREEMNYLALVLNHLVYAGLMTWLFPFFYRTKPEKSRAFLFGVVIATLMFLPQAMVVRAIWKVDFNGIFVANTLAHLVIGGIMSWVMALLYKPEKQQA